eukprot:scaffold224371_cov21-Tisochrysis_lutea.AAC.1
MLLATPGAREISLAALAACHSPCWLPTLSMFVVCAGVHGVHVPPAREGRAVPAVCCPAAAMVRQCVAFGFG